MGESELRKLVRSYTNGMIPLEMYREQRRHIIDVIVGVPGATSPNIEESIHTSHNIPPVESLTDEAMPVNENDPLQALSQAGSQKPALSFNFKPLLIYGGLSIALTAGLVIGFLPDSDPEANLAEVQENLISSVNNQFTSRAKTLVDSFLENNEWNDLQINQFILDWELLDAEEKYQALHTEWGKAFAQLIKDRLAQVNSKPDTESPLTSLIATIDPSYMQIASISNVPETSGISHTVNEPPQTQSVAKAAKTNANPSRLDSKQLNRVLNKLSTAYEKGRLKEVMGLFSEDAATNHHNSSAEIEADYKQLFQTTRSRKIQFSDFSWTRKGSTIQGKGKYLAQLNPTNTNVDQVFSADVTVHLKENKGFKIKGLYLINQKFSTKLNQQAVALNRQAGTKPPNNEELQLLIARFVTYYDDGDVERLMGLFSREARTNETASLDDIRKDYIDLFRSTQTRRINIKSLTWKTSGKLAVGSGLFEATLQPQNTNDKRTVKGRIRISATKTDKNVFITRLLHNAQE
ncbi:MAG: hypothetical protein OEZ68_18000 [Gammaproteobacteria bacterium]|nr:hypothetical protein [Gammaproteobacteria bacterium]MDH5802698.1 hypothetical protein [Gammaproteobacteria bacterium]